MKVRVLLWQNHRMDAERQATEVAGHCTRVAGSFSTPIELIPEPAIVFALDGTILGANAAAMALLDTEAREGLIGKSIFSIGGLNEPLEQELMNDLRAGKVMHFEVDFCGLKGWRKIDVVNVPVRNSSGTIDHIIGYGRDITEVRRVEQVNSLLVSIVESSDDAIISIGTDFRILTWNEAAHRLLGYTAEEAIGQNALDLYVPADIRDYAKKNMLEDFAAVDEAAAVRRLEVPMQRRDGTLVDVSLVASRIHSKTGDVIGMSVIVRDITERRRAEHEQVMLATIVGACEDAIITVSRDAQILSWNSAAEKYYGYTAEEAVGRGLSLFLSPEELEQSIKRIDHVILTGEPVTWEQEARGRDGKRSFSSVSIFPMRDQAANIIGVAGIGRDISKLKKIETELRAAQDYTRGLIESSIDSMVVVDREMRITDANERLAAMTELPKKILIGSRFDSYFADPAQAAEAVTRALSDGFITDCDLVLRTASGRNLLVSFNASICGHAGNVLGIFGVARDVTEQRAIERKLREEREYSRSLVQFSPDALLVSDSKFTITDVNERAVQLTGYSSTELVGSGLFALFTDVERVSKAVTQPGETNGVTDVELLTKDARRVPVSITCSQLEDSSGNPRLLVVGLRDISERKRYEKERSFLASIVDSSGDAIYTGSPDLTISSWNAAAEALFGYSAAEIVGHNVAVLVPLELRAEFFQHIARLHETGRSEHFETRRLRKDGRAVEVAITQSPIFDSHGKLTALAVTTRDITERKAIESELLKARDSALEVSRLKSEFLANMSHEIRTPLNSIVGLTGLLLDTELNIEQREFACDVRDSGETLLSLINEILDLSKLASRKIVLEEIDFELSGVIETVRELVSDQVRRKHLNMTVSIDEDVPRYLRGDPARLRQVLLNLLANAVKFTNQGEVSIRVSKLRESSMSSVIRFEVVDSGIGIAEDKLHLLFQPFSQVDASMTRRFGGTGLGLSIARELVQLMRGTISVSSRLGRGSNFWFTAEFLKPVGVETAVAGAAQTPDPSVPSANDKSVSPKTRKKPPERRLRALVVEDNSINQKVACLQLRKLKIDSETVGNGREAVEAVSRFQYDVVLMDCQMPEMDGYQATREIRRREGTARHTRIVAVTAHALEGDREKCLEAGMDAYISKPVKLEALKKILEEMISPDDADHEPPSSSKNEIAVVPPSDCNAVSNQSIEDESKSTACSIRDEMKPEQNRPVEDCAPVDADTIAQLKTEDDDLLPDLIDVYNRSMPANLRKLEQAFEAGDNQTAALVAHTLKGTALTFGASRMQALAAEIEQAAKVGSIRESVAELEPLRAECERVREALNHEYNVAS